MPAVTRSAQKAGSPRLTKLLSQIETLQAEADRVRAKEKDEVVARIRSAIEAYELSPEHLFGKAKPDRKPKLKVVKAGKAMGKAAPAKKKRSRRTFTDDERSKLLTQHTALVTEGLTFNAAADKIKVQQSLLRRWYGEQDLPIPQRKAA
jgi:hypothetical protein